MIDDFGIDDWGLRIRTNIVFNRNHQIRNLRFSSVFNSQSSIPRVRRGARVVESGGLENRCTRKGTVGSNPTLSAKEELMNDER